MSCTHVARFSLLLLTLVVAQRSAASDIDCNDRDKAQARIVGGNDANPMTAGWQVSLRFRGDHFCGGSLIFDGSWVLTAAHCVAAVKKGGATIDDLSIAHGSLNVRNGEEIAAKAWFVHERYVDAEQGNDIALIQLTKPFGIAPKGRVRQVAVPAAKARVGSPGACARVTGWGRTLSGGSGSESEKLLQVDVPVLEHSDCERRYGKLLPKDQICAGVVAGGKDSCQGDSGGPLVIEDGLGAITQIGVVSWGGPGCGVMDRPGLYTSVAAHAQWLRDTIQRHRRRR